ncbi:unnamed protein product [Chrysoparadoxa australica]
MQPPLLGWLHLLLGCGSCLALEHFAQPLPGHLVRSNGYQQVSHCVSTFAGPSRRMQRPKTRQRKQRHLQMYILEERIHTVRQSFANTIVNLQDRCKAWRESVTQARIVKATSLGTALLVLYIFFSSRRTGISLLDLFFYKAQLFLIAPTLVKVVGMACISGAFIVLGGVLYRGATGSTKQMALLKAYSLLNNAPGTSSVDEESTTAMVVANVLYLAGLLTFSVFLGLIANEISNIVSEVQAGNFQVADSGHTVILNWNEQTIPVLRQFAIAQKEGRKGLTGKPVVVLADKPKEEMDAEIGKALTSDDGSSLVVLARQGRPSRVEDLDLVGAGRAKRSVLLRPEGAASGTVEAARSRLLIQTVALLSVQRDSALTSRGQATPITVLHLPQDIVGLEKSTNSGEDPMVGSLAATFKSTVDGNPLRGSRVSLPERAYASRLVGQCIIQPGVSAIQGEILTHGASECEFYLKPVHRWPWIAAQSYDSVTRMFPNSVVCGVLREGGEGESQIISDDPDLRFQAGDQLLFLSRSYGNIKPIGLPMKVRCGLSEPEIIAQAKAGTPVKTRSKEKIAIINWNPGMSELLSEVEEAAVKGTKVSILVQPKWADRLAKEMSTRKWKNLHISVIHGQPVSKRSLTQAGVGKADTVILLQDRGNTYSQDYLLASENDDSSYSTENEKVSRDSQSLASLALIQQIKSERGNGHTSSHLIACFHVPRAMALAQSMAEAPGLWGETDLFLPEDLDSGVLVQVTT